METPCLAQFSVISPHVYMFTPFFKSSQRTVRGRHVLSLQEFSEFFLLFVLLLPSSFDWTLKEVIKIHPTIIQINKYPRPHHCMLTFLLGIHLAVRL